MADQSASPGSVTAPSHGLQGRGYTGQSTPPETRGRWCFLTLPRSPTTSSSTRDLSARGTPRRRIPGISPVAVESPRHLLANFKFLDRIGHIHHLLRKRTQLFSAQNAFGVQPRGKSDHFRLFARGQLPDFFDHVIRAHAVTVSANWLPVQSLSDSGPLEEDASIKPMASSRDSIDSPVPMCRKMPRLRDRPLLLPLEADANASCV